jgi:hypothetical protein
MITEINDKITIWTKFDLAKLSMDKTSPPNILFNEEQISINDCWFDILSPSELVRKRNKEDGYYRVIYIQINLESGEYYIGKANRPTWKQLERYQGSGLKFKNKFNRHHNNFVRFYIASCKNSEETELLESSILTPEILSDEKCLNLVAGGGGLNKHTSSAETSEKKRAHMQRHPEQYQSMLKASKKAFQSGDTQSLRDRNQRIKETMSDKKYRDMTRTRIEKWIQENPEKYKESRKKNVESLQSTESKEKRKASFNSWIAKNPEKHKVWQEKLIKSRTSPEAIAKRKASLKKWRDANPQQAAENAKKRAKSSAAITSKEVCMVDLESGNNLKTFPSQHAAARWLVENGKAKNTNCVTSISSVCRKSPCTTGYGYRKKAYGYGWCFGA